MDAAGPGCLLLEEVKQLFVGGRLLEQKNLSHLVLLVRKFSHKASAPSFFTLAARVRRPAFWSSGLQDCF